MDTEYHPPTYGLGTLLSKEFWNCADIEIVSGTFAKIRRGAG